jgi:VWFA-related protein
MRWRAAGLVSLCVALRWEADPQPPAIIKTETRVVVVDVVVTDKKGAYVHDLTAKNFHVLEDNKEQAIQSATLESVAPTTAAARTDYIVLVFDYSSMDSGDQIRARQAAAGFIDANLGSNRRMAVANLDAGLRIAQSFTDHAGRLKEAVNGSKAADISANSSNNALIGTSASADLGTRAKFQALNRLASDLSAVPGRKTVVLLTAGVTVRSDQKGILTEAIEACNRANVAVYPVDVRDASVPSGFSADTPETGRGRGPTALATPMPRITGVAASPSARPGPSGDADAETTADPTGANQQVLFALATGTGGFVIRNAAELPSGLQKIGQEQEEYYLLSYTPPSSPQNAPPGSKVGTCHALKVKVDRSGTTLRARSSYCNGKPEELVSGTAAQQDLEKRAGAAQGGSIAASMRLPFFYTGPNQASVHVVLEFPPDSVKFEKQKQSLHADVNILGIAATEAGETASRFSDTLTLDFDQTGQKWKEKPIHYEQEVKLAPGQYTFTVVFSAGGENFGKLAQPLTVEPYQSGQFTLSGIALGKEVRKAAAPSALSLFEDRPSLIIGGSELIPTAAAAFNKSESAYCYFEVYPAADPSAASTAQVRILNTRTNQAAWDSGVGKLDIPAGKSSIPAGLNLPLASLAAGFYDLEVTANDGSGHAVRRTASFEIK